MGYFKMLVFRGREKVKYIRRRMHEWKTCGQSEEVNVLVDEFLSHNRCRRKLLTRKIIKIPCVMIDMPG